MKSDSIVTPKKIPELLTDSKSFCPRESRMSALSARKDGRRRSMARLVDRSQMRATTAWRPVLLPHGCAACISEGGSDRASVRSMTGLPRIIVDQSITIYCNDYPSHFNLRLFTKQRTRREDALRASYAPL